MKWSETDSYPGYSRPDGWCLRLDGRAEDWVTGAIMPSYWVWDGRNVSPPDSITVRLAGAINEMV